MIKLSKTSVNAECDGVTRENNTYFATPTGTLITTPSECSVKVCSVDTEIVQVKQA